MANLDQMKVDVKYRSQRLNHKLQFGNVSQDYTHYYWTDSNFKNLFYCSINLIFLKDLYS